MILNDDNNKYHNLHLLYLDSIREQALPRSLTGFTPDQGITGNLSGGKKQSAFVGSIMIMPRDQDLICCLVVSELDDERCMALKLSPFPEFSDLSDLIVKSWAGVYVALPENSFWLDARDLDASFEVDRVDGFSLIDAQEFLENGYTMPDHFSFQAFCPPRWRHSFVENEFELSCELRGRGLDRQPLIRVPQMFLRDVPDDTVNLYRSRPTRIERLEQEPVEFSKTDKIVSHLSMSISDLPPLFEPLKDIVSRSDGNYELRFHSQMQGLNALIRLGSYPIFKGPLPDSIPMVLPRELSVERLRELIRVELIQGVCT